MKEALPVASSWCVLPHEWVFGGFLALMALRLTWQAGPLDLHTMVFFALFLGGIAVLCWAGPRPTPLRWRIRLLWYPCAMGLSYYALPAAIAMLHVPMADARLAGWDVALLGFEPARAMAGVQTPLLTDAMVVAYVFFFYYLFLGPAHYCLHNLAQFRACFAGLFTLYAFGFLGYTLLPAGGPHLAMTGLPPLRADAPAHFVLNLLDDGSNGVDVFPSIHVAVSLYLLLFDARHFRRRFWILLLPCIALWFSTVYLRYHYVVDLLGGAAIAAIGLVTAWFYEHSRLARALDAAGGDRP
ncbi:MAG: phosphatase PAP2 family protein [Stenotrophobium sp.]